MSRTSSEPAVAAGPSPAALVPASRPIIQPTAPERYRVQFTIGQDTHEKLRRLQALLRREIPDGDPAAIFDRAVTLLLEKVENKKLGATTKPRPRAVIRPGTDRPSSRDAPRAVKRVVWRRDAGQCAYVAADGRRCSEKTFLEFHHVQAHALKGPATVENISLRCWRHNQYEAELIFGPGGARVRRLFPAHERAVVGRPPRHSPITFTRTRLARRPSNSLEDLLPGAAVELAFDDRDDDLAAHDLPLVVSVAVRSSLIQG
jgi:5-methylcytosine-specific restriction endonuclease McrA